MPRKLGKLLLDRVDLVPEGANPGAHLLLFKNEAGEGEPIDKATFEEIRSSRALGEMLQQVCEYTWDLQDAIYSSLYSDGNRAAEVKQSVNQFSEAVDAALKDWLSGKPVEMAKVSELATRLGEIRKAFTSAKAEEEHVEKNNENGTVDVQKQIDAATAALRKEFEDKLAASSAEVAKAKSEAEAAKTEAAAAKSEAAVEKDARLKTEYVAKAKSDFGHLPGSDDEKGALYMALAKQLDDETFTKTVAALKAGDAALKTVLAEKGIENAGLSDAETEIEAKAQDILKAKPTLTIEQARVEAYEANPELTQKMRAEQRARRGNRE